MREWYSNAELDGVPGIPSTRHWRSKVAKRDGWRARPRKGQGGGTEYHIKSLPQPAQDYLIRQHYTPAETADALPATQTAQPPAPAPASAQPRDLAPVVIPTNAELTDWQRRTRDARLLLLGLVDDLERTLGSTAKAVARVEELSRLGELPPAHAAALDTANARRGHRSGISAATLYRWIEARGTDPNALAPAAAPVRDHPAWLPALLELYQDPRKPSVADCLRQLAKRAADDLPLPSERTAAAWIKRLPPAVTQWGRMGTRARRSIRPFVRRTTDGLWPMDIVAVDGHTIKAWVAHPLSGERFRPEVTTYLDLATRRIVGFSAWVAESAYAIWLAYRRVVLDPDCGIPALQYSDNGAYRADEHTALLERIGTSQAHSLPGNPQANGAIERINRSVWIPLAKQLPLYAGRDMDKEAFKRIKAQADKTGEYILPWTDFLRAATEAAAEYNAREHSSLTRGRTRLTPDAAWAEAKAEGWQPTLLQGDDLHDLLPVEVADPGAAAVGGVVGGRHRGPGDARAHRGPGADPAAGAALHRPAGQRRAPLRRAQGIAPAPRRRRRTGPDRAGLFRRLFRQLLRAAGR